jgi:hypothetical protein
MIAPEVPLQHWRPTENTTYCPVELVGYTHAQRVKLVPRAGEYVSRPAKVFPPKYTPDAVPATSGLKEYVPAEKESELPFA